MPSLPEDGIWFGSVGTDLLGIYIEKEQCMLLFT